MSRRLPSATAAATPPDRRWRALAACAVAGFFGVVALLAGGFWPIVLERLIIDGSVAVLWLIAAAGIGAALLRLGRINCDSRALALATSAGLGIGAMSLAVLGLGLCGLLNRASAIAVIALGLLAFVMHVAPRFSRVSLRVAEFQTANWLWLLLAPSAAITTVAAVMPPGILWGDEPHGYDVVEYHLQVPREWYESGRIEPLHHNVFSYFPFNVEMHYLLAMHLKGGPWNGMYLAQFVNLVMIALTITALGGIAKPQAAIVAGASPWMMLLGSVAYNECGLLLFGTLSIGWAIRAKGIREFMLAGAFAGFACGTKPTAAPMLLLAVPLALYLPFLFRERVAGKAVAGFMLAGLVTFSPWPIRNLAWTGNPVFPEATSVFGRAHFSEAQSQRWAMRISARPGDRLTAPWKQVVGDWRYGFVFVPLALVAAAVGRQRTSRVLIAILIVQFLFWIGFTHVQGRFLVLAIPIAAILIGQLELPHWNKLVSVAAIVIASIGWIVAGPRVMATAPALGARDLSPLTPDVAVDAMNGGRALVLVGDARAFWYTIPMTRLRYRTVFDVDVKPGQTVIDAWIGSDKPTDAVVVVTPSELDRFAKTYSMIPPMQFHSTEPYVLPP